MKSQLPLLVFIGFGIFLVLLSLVWGILFPPSRAWSEEKAQRMNELGQEVRQLNIAAIRAKERPRPGGPSPTEAKAEYQAAKQELETLESEFQSIRDRPQTAGTYLRWAGIGLVLLGGMGHLVTRAG